MHDTTEGGQTSQPRAGRNWVHDSLFDALLRLLPHLAQAFSLAEPKKTAAVGSGIGGNNKISSVHRQRVIPPDVMACHLPSLFGLLRRRCCSASRVERIADCHIRNQDHVGCHWIQRDDVG